MKTGPAIAGPVGPRATPMLYITGLNCAKRVSKYILLEQCSLSRLVAISCYYNNNNNKSNYPTSFKVMFPIFMKYEIPLIRKQLK